MSVAPRWATISSWRIATSSNRESGGLRSEDGGRGRPDRRGGEGGQRGLEGGAQSASRTGLWHGQGGWLGHAWHHQVRGSGSGQDDHPQARRSPE
eukprot:14565213-Heterocapsa_arctica.AAC.1